MMTVKYPIVPKAPGVPPVLRKQAPLVGAAVLLLKDSVRALLGAPEQWGIFLNGKSVLAFSSILSLDARGESHVSDYPVEAGGFESYNKVQMPGDLRITVSKMGTVSEKNKFLVAIKAMKNSTGVYDIYTNWGPYSGYSLVRYNYRRTALNGADLLVVDLFFDEIVEKASAVFSSVETATAQPSGAPQVNVGAIQTAPLPSSLPSKASIQSPDNLPGFTKPLIDYSSLGFQ